MTDPLRPFADMIRALWLARTKNPGVTGSSASAKTGAVNSVSRRVRSLRSHVKSRVAACSGLGSARMREAFVEAVLVWELGEELARDSAFGEMVANVSEQLASDPAVGERLNRALTRLAADPRA
jgi:hypothetical protein